MAFWKVEVNTRDAMPWPPPGCVVIATTQWIGNWTVLLEADPANAAAIRSHPNVTSIDPAPDGHYPDRDSGYT